MLTSDFTRGENHKDCSQTNTDCKRERERQGCHSGCISLLKALKVRQPSIKWNVSNYVHNDNKGKQRPSPVDTYNHMGRYTNTITDLRSVVSWVAWPTLKLVWPWLAGIPPMGVSLTTEAETKRHMCHCVYVYSWVFAKVGSRVHMLLRVTHCVCICVLLPMSLGVMEDVRLDVCDTVGVWERKGQQGRGKMKLKLENLEKRRFPGPERATDNWWKNATCNATNPQYDWIKYPVIILQHVCRCPITLWPKDKCLRQIKPAVAPSTPPPSLFLSRTNKNTTLGANSPSLCLTLSRTQSKPITVLVEGDNWSILIFN